MEGTGFRVNSLLDAPGFVPDPPEGGDLTALKQYYAEIGALDIAQRIHKEQADALTIEVASWLITAGESAQIIKPVWELLSTTSLQRETRGRVLSALTESATARLKSSFECYTEHWPGNRGFVIGTDSYVTLNEGLIISRFGADSGAFVALDGTSFEGRGLFECYRSAMLNRYRVLKPIGHVRAGPSQPWAGNRGLDIQLDFVEDRTIGRLIHEGYLGRITNVPK